jgi:hypothetical protein
VLEALKGIPVGTDPGKEIPNLFSSIVALTLFLENDVWVLCGPDKASLRLGVRLGFRERLVALETLLNDAGFRAKQSLKTNYSAKWLAQTLSEIVVMEGLKSP